MCTAYCVAGGQPRGLLKRSLQAAGRDRNTQSHARVPLTSSTKMNQMYATAKTIRLLEENTRVNLYNSRMGSGLGKMDKLLNFMNVQKKLKYL